VTTLILMYVISPAQSPAKSRQQRRRQAADPAAPAPARRLSGLGAQSFPSRATGSAGSPSTTVGLVFARLALTDRSSAGQFVRTESRNKSHDIHRIINKEADRIVTKIEFVQCLGYFLVYFSAGLQSCRATVPPTLKTLQCL
jgi:hypothetical protein